MPGFGSGPFGSGPFGEWPWSRRVLFESIPEIYKQLDIENGGLLEMFAEGLRPSFDEIRSLSRDLIETIDPNLVRTQYDRVKRLRLGPVLQDKGTIEQIGIVASVDAIQQFRAPTARFTALALGQELFVTGSSFPQNNRKVSVIRVISPTIVFTDPPLVVDAGPLRWELRTKVEISTEKVTVEVRSGDVSEINPSWLLFDGFADFEVLARRQFKANVDDNQLLTEQEGTDGNIDGSGRFFSDTALLTQNDVGKQITLLGSAILTNNGRYEITRVVEVVPGDVRAELDTDPVLLIDSELAWAVLPYGELDLVGTVIPKGVVEQEGSDLSITVSGVSDATVSSMSGAFTSDDLGKRLSIRGSVAPTSNDGTYRVIEVVSTQVLKIAQRSPVLTVETTAELTWELRTSTLVGDLVQTDVRATSMITDFSPNFGIEVDTQESEARQRSWVRNVSRWTNIKGTYDAYRIVGAISGFDVSTFQLFRITPALFSLAPSAHAFEVGEAGDGRNGTDGALFLSGILLRLSSPTALFVHTDVGRQIRIRSANLSGNNKLYTIGTFISPTEVEFSLGDTATLPDVNNGLLGWSIVRLYTDLPPLRPRFDEVNADLLEAIVETASNNFLTFRADKYCWEDDFDSTARINVLAVTTPTPGVQRIEATGTTSFANTPEIVLTIGNWEFVCLIPGSSGIGDLFSGSAPNITFRDAAGNFDASLVGRWISISGATTSANNGLFQIVGAPTPTTLTVFNGNAVAETFPGTYQFYAEAPFFADTLPTLTGAISSVLATSTGDSFTKVGSGVDVRLADSSALFTGSMVGKHVRITGATSPGNNGIFLIRSQPSSTIVEYENPDAVTEAFTGTWQVGLGVYAFQVLAASLPAGSGPALLRYACAPQLSCDYCGSNKVLAIVEATPALLAEPDVQVERLFERVVARLDEVKPIHVELVAHFRATITASVTLSVTVEPP
jgi:hypothetical protein